MTLGYVAGSAVEKGAGALGIIGRVLVAGGCRGDREEITDHPILAHSLRMVGAKRRHQ